MAQPDPISAFTADGLRWVLSTLKARTEVAAVMEAMLDTVEVSHIALTPEAGEGVTISGPTSCCRLVYSTGV